MLVHSDLWLDQPDAHARIEPPRRAAVLTATAAEQLHGFLDNGLMQPAPGLDEAFCDALGPGTVNCGQNVSRERRAEFAVWQQEQLRENGLERQAFTCSRGDVFIWHGGLVHGGDEIQTPGKTRKSFVVHYTTAANYDSRTARMQVRDGEGLRTVARRTEKVIERDSARGLDSPLRGSGELVSPKSAHPRPAARLARLVERVNPWSERRTVGSRSGRTAERNKSA